jgi:hypothetical protein
MSQREAMQNGTYARPLSPIARWSTTIAANGYPDRRRNRASDLVGPLHIRFGGRFARDPHLDLLRMRRHLAPDEDSGLVQGRKVAIQEIARYAT